MTPVGICVHNTANSASARNEINYMKNNNNEVSFHVAIDDVESIQAIPFNRNSWSCGDGVNGNGNRKHINIEICYSTSNLELFKKAEKNAIKEIALILKQYNWTISNVKKHQDFSGKYCPHRTLDLGWQRFLNEIEKELLKLNTTTVTPTKIYKVQVGAYSKLENAKAMQEKLKKLGIESIIKE